jgi:hypothetical protein
MNRLLVSLCGLPLLGCASFGADWDNHVTGSIEVEGTRLGSFTTTFPRCESGTHQMYFGADLHGNGGASMRVVVDPTRGPVLQLTKTGAAEEIDLTKETCPTFDVDVRRVTDSSFVSGNLTFACPAKTGGTVKGSVVFKCM